MATQAVHSSSFLRQAVRTPHGVRIAIPLKHPWSDIKAWLKDRAHKGKYRFDEGVVAYMFWFSEENTAFEFKVRFG